MILPMIVELRWQDLGGYLHTLNCGQRILGSVRKVQTPMMSSKGQQEHREYAAEALCGAELDPETPKAFPLGLYRSVDIAKAAVEHFLEESAYFLLYSTTEELSELGFVDWVKEDGGWEALKHQGDPEENPYGYMAGSVMPISEDLFAVRITEGEDVMWSSRRASLSAAKDCVESMMWLYIKAACARRRGKEA